MTGPPRELVPALKNALAYAATGDRYSMVQALEPIFQLEDDTALHAAFTGTCAVIQEMNPYFAPDPEAFLGFDLIGPLGNIIEPEDADPTMRGQVFAMRFLLAWCNGGNRRVRDTADLFYATSPDVLAKGFLALLDVAGAELRAKAGAA